MNRFLSFLNLLERSGKISLTNVALVVLIVKVALAPVVTIADAAVLFLGILNYIHKRHESGRAEKAATQSQVDSYETLRAEFSEQVTQLRDEIGKVSMASGIFKR